LGRPASTFIKLDIFSERNAYKNLVANPKEKDHSEDRILGGKITLMNLKEYDMRMQIEFVCIGK
jgi:hypothetical protein